jgi:hypothetical protein
VRYQLVVQVSGDTSGDLDALVALENEIVDVLGSTGEVDGHDIGSGEGNIFVLTDRPVEAFSQIRSLLAERRLLTSARVAYRNAGGERYTVLWPEESDGPFRVL